MGALWAIYLIFVLFAVSQSTIISRKYIPKLEFDDKKSSNELLKEYNSTSSIECAALCQRECSFNGFNSHKKKCRIHKKFFTSEMSNEGGWRYYPLDFPALVTPIDCKDLHADGQSNSGVYDIYPYGSITSPIRVYCEMEIMDGGWTAIQKRVNGSLSFNRTWTEYKNGFGSPEQDVWNGTTLYEMYDRFAVFNETENYKLFLSGPATGTLGDSMLNTGYSSRDLSGMYFSTPDRDKGWI
ncbi:fibroleukin-like [Saccostrea echinata]|uniref:fibroleukin-like n=1 Tax=Saccostrea echinata TaxID=191078 RepID=UPI002A7F9CF9|nr:fibroleukin-like [Saccostrea echinata]